jgi:hypothetical protein
MKKKISQLQHFLNLVKLYSQAKGEGALTKLDKKLKSQIESFSEKIDAHNKKVEDLRVDYCSEDKFKNLIFDKHGNYSFTRENMKILNEEIAKLTSKEVDIEIVLTKKDLEGCPDPFRTAFMDFIGETEAETA